MNKILSHSRLRVPKTSPCGKNTRIKNSTPINKITPLCYTNENMKKETKVILTLSCFILLSLYFSLQKNTASSPNRHQTDNSLQTLSLRKDNIAILYIEGPISYQMSGQFYTQNKLDDLIAQLHEYEDNPKVKALILRINSPGGTVGSSQELYQELNLEFKNVYI